MTVTPEVQPVGGTGYVDYGQPGALPSFPDAVERSSTPRVSPITQRTRTNYKYVRPNLWGKNGYFMNGPYADPFDEAQSASNMIKSYTASFSEPQRRRVVDDFSSLLNTYGHTNSPGVLWSIANSNLPVANPLTQKILATDAKASMEDYARSAPVGANSPSANNDEGWMDSFWKPFQAVSRNAFAALSMPMEAVQGAIRGVGGALTEEGGPDIAEAVAQVGSLIPPIALWGNAVRGDNEFINPWEQTEFGQTLLSAAGGKGMDAFFGQQAGLDIDKAREELLLDPKYKELTTTAEGQAELDYLASNLAKEKGYYGQEGWFIDETSNIGETQRRATFDTWAIPGKDDELTAWTLGRGIFSNVGGPDWAGYGVASGIVDAVAAIFLDPTVIGSKFGVASKTLRGIGRVLETGGIEGAERTLTIGKELAKERAAYGTAARGIEKAQKTIASDSAQEAAARLGIEIIDEVDPDEIAKMDLQATSTMVRDSRIADIAETALAGVKTDAQFVATEARNVRREVIGSQRIDNILADATSSTPAAEATAARAIWEDYLTVFDPIGSGQYQINTSRFYSFINRTFGRSEKSPSDPTAGVLAEGDITRPENVALWTKLNRQHDKAIKDGLVSPDDFVGEQQFLNLLDETNALKVKRPKDIPAAQVEFDGARIFATENADADSAFLASQDVLGALTIQAPVKGQAVLGNVDGVESVIYWTGRKGPNLVQGGDLVDLRVRGRIGKQLDDVLSRDELNISDVPSPMDVIDSLPSQVSKEIAEIFNVRKALSDLLALPTLTYAQLLKFAKDVGIDGIFDDVLRAEAKFDGIVGIDPIDGRGIWMGDHPSLLSYAVNDTARESGKSVRGMDDVEMGLSGIGMADTPMATATGLRALPYEELSNMRNGNLQKAQEQMMGIENYRRDRMFYAGTKDQQLRAQVGEVIRRFDDPVQALKDTIGWHAGLRNKTTNSLTLDTASVRKFLFGSGPGAYFANKVFSAIGNIVSEADRTKAVAAGVDSEDYALIMKRAMSELFNITNGKWDPETYKMLARNSIDGGGSGGVLGVLAPRLGIDVTKGTLSRGVKVVDSDGTNHFRSWRTPSPVVARMLGQMPTSRKVNLQNADEVAEAILLYGRYARVDENTLNEIIGDVLYNAGSMEAVGVNRNALAKTFNVIGDVLVTKLEDSRTGQLLYKGKRGEIRANQIKEAIRSSTRLWLGGETDELTENIALFGTNSATNRITGADGTDMGIPDILLDTEIAQGYVGLPSVNDWQGALSRFGMAVERLGPVAAGYDFAKRFFDNFFRTSMLVLRVSYIIRNVAEMQVRMFLNGHHSMMSDPLTMIGMTVGNLADARKVRNYTKRRSEIADEIFTETGRKAKKSEIDERAGQFKSFADMYAPYKDTILGTRWETGLDEQLAVANQVEDYFALIRLAHSLTDPRVYNSAVRQGWQAIAYGTPSFNKGWAHELIMLERSGLARLVVAGPDPSFAGVVNATGTMDAESLAIEWLRSDAALNLRKLMIGADPKFKEIFDDPSAIRQFLYDNPNSVQNRIIQYTRNDPRLMDYIRTGKLRYGDGESLSLRNVPDAGKRIDAFATVLSKNFNDEEWAQHFTSAGTNGTAIKVPWIENIDRQPGMRLFNKFFDWANKIERIGAVGPEFRMAYWDKIAELAPGLRSSDVPRALSAARTTLSPLKRMSDNGTLDNFGANHPAFKALKKAADENSDGLLTVDEIHGIASTYAAEVVKELFYDAARRNNMWNALRLIFPFGQAWGNTIESWGKLAAKKPIQIYKTQKALNSLIETGSSAIYEFGSEVGLYGQYAPGQAPWEQSTNGGFFYTDQYGESSFMYPSFIGRAAALPLNVASSIFGGPNIPDIPLQSPAASLNLALGMDSVFPGVSAVGALPLSSEILPDNELIASIREIATPLGEKNIVEASIPSWFSKVLGGVGALPIVGDVLGGWVDVLAPANKNKSLKDAMMILSNSGDYADWATNPVTARKLRDDASALGKAFVLTTGLIQNVLPSTPYPQMATVLSGDDFKGQLESTTPTLYTIGILNTMFQQYRERNGYDDTAAREEMLKDLGPAAMFATTGDWKNLSRIPTSDALKFARKNPELAKANLDEFTLFFPEGDSSDVAAMMWIKEYGKGDRSRKTKDEVFGEIVTFLERVQRFRLQSMEANDLINGQEAEYGREQIYQTYLETGETSGAYINKTEEMDKLNKFVERYPQIQQTNGGQAFIEAWRIRTHALKEARELTGREDAGLGGEKVAGIKEWYVSKMDALEAQVPDFKLLASKFRREWD